jgi:hypothetical protein
MPKNACCEDAANLVVKTDPERPELTIRVCQVCGARHFVLKAEPGVLGLKVGRGA